MRTAGVFLALVLVMALAGCSPAFWDAMARGSGRRLLLFGGEDHDVYLGCICSEYSGDSIFNQYSGYGNAYSPTSILNHYGSYGSPYSSYSPCNPYATSPPVVVDRDGNFYGYLTVNAYALHAYRDPNVQRWLEAECGK